MKTSLSSVVNFSKSKINFCQNFQTYHMHAECTPTSKSDMKNYFSSCSGPRYTLYPQQGSTFNVQEGLLACRMHANRMHANIWFWYENLLPVNVQRSGLFRRGYFVKKIQTMTQIVNFFVSCQLQLYSSSTKGVKWKFSSSIVKVNACLKHSGFLMRHTPDIETSSRYNRLPLLTRTSRNP